MKKITAILLFTLIISYTYGQKNVKNGLLITIVR